MKIEKEKCTGCHACYSICPKHCIEMQADNDGFLYPKIDRTICINCGRCENICPALNKPAPQKIGQAYACINKNDEVRMQSSSGGVFTLIAEYVINNGGAVFGAAFDENLSVRHIMIESVNDLGKLRGSKYVQSSIGNSYKEAKNLLECGRIVLFSGTPCQISGLLSYLGKEYSNLITQDLICHGVPPASVWHKYLDWLASVYSAAVDQRTAPSFRDKSTGWKSYSLSVSFTDGKKSAKTFSEDLFMRAFLNDLDLRPSCYCCPSKGIQRQSDITLADFWGIENIVPEMFDNKGTSLVIVNSDKGKQLFDTISPQMIIKEVDTQQALIYNPAAYKSSVLSPARERFMYLINEADFEKAIRKSINNSIIKRTLRKIKRIIERVY